MIQPASRLVIADNTGARVAMCIGMLGKNHVASVGRVISVTIKKVKPGAKVKQGEVHKAVIVRTKKELGRDDGRWVKFDDNAAVLLTPDFKPMGTRVIGPVAAELRKLNWMKIVSLAEKII